LENQKTPGPDLAGGGPGAQLTWGHLVGDCKPKVTHTHITNEKKDMKGLVGGLGPGPPPLP